MIEKIKGLLVRHREMFLYLIFGGLTTVVDWGVSFTLYAVFGDAIDKNSFVVHFANVAAWAAAVTFAFVTNRIWVFQSKKHGFLPVLGEFLSFAGGRVTTLLLQELIFLIFVDGLGVSEYVIKLVAAILVVVLNYVISKLFVFRKQKREDGE